MKQTAHKGHNAKHAGTHKHTQGNGKHHPAKAHKAQTHHHAHQKQHAHTAAKGPKVAKPRKLAWAESRVRPGITPFQEQDSRSRERLDGPGAWALADVACCSAEALAWSLRLSGWPVGVADVLDLYKLTADGPDAGASILATLDAASVFGLAGVRPVSWSPVVVLDGPARPGGLGLFEPPEGSPLTLPLTLLPFTPEGPAGARSPELPPGPVGRGSPVPLGVVAAAHSLILGLELPGPHAVCQQDGQWWTWGEPYDPCCFPDAVVEEAWAVTWP